MVIHMVKKAFEKENLKDEITIEDEEVAGFESDDNSRVGLDEIAGEEDANTDNMDRVAECESTQSTVFISKESNRQLASDSVAGSRREQHEGVPLLKLSTTRSHLHAPVTVLNYKDGFGDEKTTKELISSLEKGSRIEVTNLPHGESPDPASAGRWTIFDSFIPSEAGTFELHRECRRERAAGSSCWIELLDRNNSTDI